MPAFQLVVCDVALNGDIRQTVHRGIDNPVTYPETLVLEFIHGPSTVTDVRAIGEIERPMDEERKRLERIYGKDNINQLFPGVVTPLPALNPGMTTFDRAPVGVSRTKDAKAMAKRVAKEQAARAAGEKVEGDADDAVPKVQPEETDDPLDANAKL